MHSNDDVNFTIGYFINEWNEPESIKGEETLNSARTKMIINNFSQLPVMKNVKGSASGVITLKSLLRNQNKINENSLVKDFMESPVYISTRDSVMKAIEVVNENEYALIKSPNSNGIVGILTTSDISSLFIEVSQGFILAGECETLLRQILENNVSSSELEFSLNKENKRARSNISDLTFNEYITLLNIDHVWEKVNTTVDKKQLNILLIEVKDIRNKIMHFRPGGISTAEIQKIKSLNRLLKSF
ncbi:MAG: CBS domain-containing protein [Spirochaetaceae bacterium]